MKLSILFPLFICFFISAASYSQFVQGIYEGEQINGNYGAASVKTIPNAGYIMLGTKSILTPNPKSQIYIHRISDSLETMWSKSIGIEGNAWGNAVDLTADGGFIITGTAESFPHNRKDIYILKLNASGEIEWSKLVGEKDGHQEGSALRVTDDGGFIVVGSTEISGQGKDVYVVKLSSIGEMEWTKRIGGSGINIAHAVNFTSDGGYIIAGETNYYQTHPYHPASYILKLDAVGNLEWTTLLDYPTPNVARDIIPTSDGGYAAVGKYSGGGYIMKLNSEGEMQWINDYFPVSLSAHFYSINTLDNGNLVAVGNAGSVSFYLVETSLDGTFIKGVEYWGQEAYQAYGADIADDGGFILVGNKKQRNRNSREKIYFIKTKPNYSSCITPLQRYDQDSKRILFKRTGGTITSSFASITNIESIEEEGLSISPVCSITLGIENFSKSTKFLIYPNPTHDLFTVESETLILRLEIATPNGKRIHSSKVNSYTKTVSMKNFSAGMYLLTIYTEVGASTRKVIVSK